MSTINKISIPLNQVDSILDFVRLVVPRINNLPTSFNAMKKMINTYNLVTKYKICQLCNNVIVDGKLCNFEGCAYQNLKKPIVKVFTSNIFEQIKTIFGNYLTSMVEYKKKMRAMRGLGKFSDIMNGRAYSFELNTFNLICFVDAVAYTKSGNRSMWAMFSTFVEMEPIIRSMNENIIYHSSWSGPMKDFNVFLKSYNCQIDEVMKDGVEFEGTNYRIKVHMLVADAPGRAKASNFKQFNGKFSCVKCLHPTIHIGIYLSFKLTYRDAFEVVPYILAQSMPMVKVISFKFGFTLVPGTI